MSLTFSLTFPLFYSSYLPCPKMSTFIGAFFIFSILPLETARYNRPYIPKSLTREPFSTLKAEILEFLLVFVSLGQTVLVPNALIILIWE